MTFMDLIQELLTFVALIPLILILLGLGKLYDLIVKKLNLPKSRFDDLSQITQQTFQTR